MIPDAEQILGAYLRDELDCNVAGRTPNSTANKWVKLVQLDATDAPGSGAEHLIDFMLQLDCYAGQEAMDDHTGQAEAWLLARTTRALLKAMIAQAFGDVVVTQVTFSGMARIPDKDFEPARERVILTASVWMHPVA